MSKEKVEMETEWITRRVDLEYKINILHQREIHLLEEMNSFNEASSSTSLIDWEITETEKENSDNILNEYRSELSDLNHRLFLLKQYRRRMRREQLLSPLTSKTVLDIENGRGWDYGREQCIASGGCCERGCGCCERPRQTSTGQKKRLNAPLSHCTFACGCCIRDRGFYTLPDEDIELFKSERLYMWVFEWMLDPQLL